MSFISQSESNFVFDLTKRFKNQKSLTKKFILETWISGRVPAISSQGHNQSLRGSFGYGSLICLHPEEVTSSKTFGFMTFSGNIEMWHWTKLG